MQLALINLTQLTRDEQRESHDPGTLLGHDKKLLLNIVSCPTVPVELWAPIGWTMVAATLGRRFLVRKGRFWGKLLLLSHMPQLVVQLCHVRCHCPGILRPGIPLHGALRFAYRAKELYSDFEDGYCIRARIRF
jgi:hypothetical protein